MLCHGKGKQNHSRILLQVAEANWADIFNIIEERRCQSLPTDLNKDKLNNVVAYIVRYQKQACHVGSLLEEH